MSKTKDTILELDLSALSHNVKYLKSKLKPNTKFLGVVKAFAYGHDAITIAKHLESLQVDYLAVAYTREGVALRQAGVSLPILILHPQAVNFNELIAHQLEPNIYSLSVLKQFIAAVSHIKGIEYPIHIKCNSVLNRLGVTKAEINTIISLLKDTKSVRVKSLFSHLAASEDENEKEFTVQQIKTFTQFAQTFQNALSYKVWLHLSNTSGVLNYPEAHLDMVRCGIGMYGFGNSAKADKHLKPVARLKSVISQIHNIKKDQTVGYNRVYKACKDERVATIPIGHADGIGRIYGNENGFVYINEKKAAIIGHVCMDMIMVNVTHINCKEGDEVIIFDATKTANNLAESAKTISYEILTGISQRVKRIILDAKA